MRPVSMWAIHNSGGLALQTAGPILISVMVFETERDARACIEQQVDRRARLNARPVSVWVAQFPSIMWRKREDTDPPESKGCEFILGV